MRLSATWAALLFVTAPSIAAEPAKLPNIVFILADDLGYGDLSCYGRPDYRTPVLDAFARQGIKFMSAYAAAPGPVRAKRCPATNPGIARTSGMWVSSYQRLNSSSRPGTGAVTTVWM